MTTQIKQLPSGYWSVWINGDWIEASSPTREHAEQILTEYIRRYVK